jgi:hypothetical protein
MDGQVKVPDTGLVNGNAGVYSTGSPLPLEKEDRRWI